MSYQMQNSKRSRVSGRFISRVHKEIQRAFTASGMRQNELALKLEVDRSVVNRQLQGKANLTLRSIADLAWALDVPITFNLGRPETVVKRNYFDSAPEKETEETGTLSAVDGVTTTTQKTASQELEYV